MFRHRRKWLTDERPALLSVEHSAYSFLRSLSNVLYMIDQSFIP